MKQFLRTLCRMNHAATFAIAALSAAGVMFIYSVGSSADGLASSVQGASSVQEKYRVQAFTALAGFALYFALAHFDYRKILAFAAAPFWAVSTLLLGATLAFGTELNSARRWLWGFQPSELAKLAVVIALAALYGRFKIGRGFKAALPGFAAIAVPAVLVNMEPDLGTVLVTVVTGVVMMLLARVWTKGLSVLVLAAVAAGAFELCTVARAEREPDPARKEEILKWTGLRPHQVRRLRVFMYPDTDILGAGYHLRQAEISVGSGGMWGRGWLNGRQTQLGYMQPSKSISDFIFAALAEEAGFAGSLAALALYAMLAASCMATALKTEDDGGRLIAAGVSTLLFCHVYENVAMNIGLMPITGLPLPFISYGRTSLVAFMAAMGLVQSVAVRSGPGAETERNG